MNEVHHGINLGLVRIDQDIILTMRAVGKLTHEDYNLITPFIESALEAVSEPHIRALIDATQLEGFELRAAWDDFKIGMKYGSDFSKVAVVGKDGWQKVLSTVGGWFISGEIMYFHDSDEALKWIISDASV